MEFGALAGRYRPRRPEFRDERCRDCAERDVTADEVADCPGSEANDPSRHGNAKESGSNTEHTLGQQHRSESWRKDAIGEVADRREKVIAGRAEVAAIDKP